MNERVRKLIEAALTLLMNDDTEAAQGYLAYLLDDSIDFSQEPTEEEMEMES